MSASKSVSVKNLSKIFDGSGGKKVTAVNNVSLTINPGEFVTLLGPSGCGKTTILRMVAGFETPTAGDVLIGEERVNTLTPDRHLGYAVQWFGLAITVLVVALVLTLKSKWNRN